MARTETASAESVKRIQIDMPSRSVLRLKELQKTTEASSYAEVVKNALRLYEALIDEIEAGHEVWIKRDGQFAPLKIFAA